MAAIKYRYDNDFDIDPVIELCHASTLGKRRPVDDRRIMLAMLRHANLVVTAWDGKLLVGIARTLSDFAYVGYLADLAFRFAPAPRCGVDPKNPGQDGTALHACLLAAPQAVKYYPKVGFTKHQSAWILRAGEPLMARH